MQIEILQTDITTLKVDAIVNAANNALCGGGGVDGAIHRVAGPKLLEECRTLGGCETGFAKITSAYDLLAKYVIHAVGPVWYGGDKNEAGLLSSCYLESLKLAEQHDVASIAFPAISCGAYRFPVEKACDIAVTQIRHWFSEKELPEIVYLACFSDKLERQYSKTLSS
ncbi:O-acetyl-ADP-ribose deacetylase [hydrothermal vent metagenome]|uniref:O-acetyl-ADP-ribose deacetylase n=1 Tax=hydrothermal vent metagenome TaxID=652676 RepID=A0A3B1A0M0_9ZZZZ